MDLKYTTADVDKMVDVFLSISEKKKKNETEGILQELVKLVDYPIPVVHEFLECMNVFSEKDENYLKENYMVVIGYIVIRLNLVDENKEILDF